MVTAWPSRRVRKRRIVPREVPRCSQNQSDPALIMSRYWSRSLSRRCSAAWREVTSAAITKSPSMKALFAIDRSRQRSVPSPARKTNARDMPPGAPKWRLSAARSLAQAARGCPSMAAGVAMRQRAIAALAATIRPSGSRTVAGDGQRRNQSAAFGSPDKRSLIQRRPPVKLYQPRLYGPFTPGIAAGCRRVGRSRRRVRRRIPSSDAVVADAGQQDAGLRIDQSALGVARAVRIGIGPRLRDDAAAGEEKSGRAKENGDRPEPRSSGRRFGAAVVAREHGTECIS